MADTTYNNLTIYKDPEGLMQKFFKLLSLVICFELIASPMLAHQSTFWVSAAHAEDCPSGTQFDSVLNRCITSEQTAEVMNAVANCNGDKECYKTNADQALKDAEAEGKIKAEVANASGLMGSGMKVAAIALPLVVTIKMVATNSGKCPATSAIIMTGAGLVAFAGDTIANKGHKKRLEEIKKEWDGIVSGTSSTSSTTTDSTSTSTSTSTTATTPVKATEGQSQAFEMLAKSEDSLEKAAKTKAGIYMVAGAGFAAATVIAGLEMMRGSAMDCKAKASANPKDSIFNNSIFNLRDFYVAKEIENTNDLALVLSAQSSSNEFSSPSIEEYEKNQSLISGLSIGQEMIQKVKEASLIVYYNLIPISEAEAAAPGMGQILESPVTRMVLGGVLAGWSVMMSMHASKQAKVAKSRAEYLRKMKDEFNDATGAISCTSRTDPNNARCYCYTDSGARSTERANSAVCTALFTGKNLATTSGSYLTGSSSTCITKTGGEDSSCACKTTNTCATVGTLSSISGLDTGTLSLTNGALKDLNAVSTGATDAANVNTAAGATKAVNLLRAANNVASKSKAGADAVKNKSALANQLSKNLTAAAAGSGMNTNLGSNSSLPSSPSQAIAALQKELEENKAQINSASGGQTLAGPSSNTPAADAALDFSLDNGQAAAQETQVAEAMKQNLDYGNADINSSSSENLFNLLSNRYQRSGMRRLFDTEGKTQADAPNKDDITK